MVTLIAISASLFLGFHLGRAEQFTSMTLEDLSLFGSFLAGLSGVVVTVLATLGFNSWKANLKAGVIAERIAKAENALEQTVSTFTSYSQVLVSLERHVKLYDDKRVAKDAKIKERRDELYDRESQSFIEYQKALGIYKIECLGMFILLGKTLKEISAESLSEDLRSIEEAAVKQIKTSPDTMNLHKAANEVLHKFKDALFNLYPFN